jgi:hypothetical protein
MIGSLRMKVRYQRRRKYENREITLLMQQTTTTQHNTPGDTASRN